MRCMKSVACLLILALLAGALNACRQPDGPRSESTAPTPAAPAATAAGTAAAPPAAPAATAPMATPAVGSQAGTPSPTPARRADLVPERPLTMLVARNKWGELTVRDIQEYAALTRAKEVVGVPFNKVGMLPNETLRKLAETVTTREAALHDLDKTTDTALVEFCSHEFNTIRENITLSYLFATQVNDKLTT
ncbi:MAG: hypothetical protein M1457_10435, partial [bacterium]|nr:hypothetical protein [bacterium]